MKNYKNNTRSYFLTPEGLEKIKSATNIPADLREKILATGINTPIPMWQMLVWADRLRPFMPKNFRAFANRRQSIKTAAEANLTIARKMGILPTINTATRHIDGSAAARTANAAVAARYMH